MRFGSILLLAVGLAMDAAAVSAARGLATPVIRTRHAVLVALFFGGFQAGMPLIGWALGSWLGPLVAQWTHWIGFVLLTAIGCKMLWDARSATEDAEDTGRDRFAIPIMFGLAIATSIDALAVGVMLPMLKAPFVLSLATIGITTALLSVLGLYAGRRFGSLLGRRLDSLGGIVLIGLGLKTFFDRG